MQVDDLPFIRFVALRNYNVITPVIGYRFNTINYLREEGVSDFTNHDPNRTASFFFQAKRYRVRPGIYTLWIFKHQLFCFLANFVTSAQGAGYR